MSRVRPPIDRFMEKIEIDPVSGCWVWVASLNGHGYGAFFAGKEGGRNKNLQAHIWAYEHFVGPVPPGHELDHVCHTQDSGCPGGVECSHRRCVNPMHLEVVTRLENLVRGRGNKGSAMLAKTHCPAGHPYDDENTYLDPRGYRGCRTCRRVQRRRCAA